jgi:hypothetical protein
MTVHLPWLLPFGCGETSKAVVAAVVVTVIVVVPVVAVELNVTVEFVMEQVGLSTVAEGLDEVNAQASVTVPA